MFIRFPLSSSTHRMERFLTATWQQYFSCTFTEELLVSYFPIVLRIGYWHHNVFVCLLCLSVTLCIVAKRYILHTAKVSEQLFAEVSPRKTILQHCQSFLTPTLSPPTSNFLNHRRWCHLENKLKPYCEQANCRNFHDGYSTIGCFKFSAIAGLLVSEWVSELEYLKGAQKQKVTMRRSVT